MHKVSLDEIMAESSLKRELWETRRIYLERVILLEYCQTVDKGIDK